MQVSWIDPEHLKGLLERLGDAAPQAKPGAVAWETHTLPAAPPVPAEPPPVPRESPPESTPPPSPPAQDAPSPATLEPAARAGSTDEEKPAAPPPPPRAEPVVHEVERVRDRLREIRERAEAAGLLKKHAEPAAASAITRAPAAPVPPAPAEPAAGAKVADTFEVPAGTVVQRLEAFADWAQARLQPGELVLLDEHGDVLAGAHAKGPLILSAMLAARAQSRSSAAGATQAEPQVVRQTLGSGAKLAVLTCATSAGPLHLAVEHPAGVDETEMRLLGTSLETAIAGRA